MIDIPKTRRILLLGMFLLAVGGLVQHLRIHPPLLAADNTDPGTGFTNLIAALFGVIDVALVTCLFARKRTAVYGYLINGLLVIYGTVFMAHCGIAKVFSPDTNPIVYILSPTFPSIVMVWADFFMGAVLYKLWFLEAPKPEAEGRVAEGAAG